jgi:hypothetical protein
VLSTKRGMDIFLEQYGNFRKCNDCRDLLHKLLWYEAWTKRDTFWRRGDNPTAAISLLSVRRIQTLYYPLAMSSGPQRPSQPPSPPIRFGLMLPWP